MRQQMAKQSSFMEPTSNHEQHASIEEALALHSVLRLACAHNVRKHYIFRRYQGT